MFVCVTLVFWQNFNSMPHIFEENRMSDSHWERATILKQKKCLVICSQISEMWVKPICMIPYKLHMLYSYKCETCRAQLIFLVALSIHHILFCGLLIRVAHQNGIIYMINTAKWHKCVTVNYVRNWKIASAPLKVGQYAT